MKALLVAPTSKATLSVRRMMDTTVRVARVMFFFILVLFGRYLLYHFATVSYTGRQNRIPATHNQKLSMHALSAAKSYTFLAFPMNAPKKCCILVKSSK